MTTQIRDWTEARDSVSEADAKAMQERIAAAFQDRLTWEHRMHPANEGKQAKIAKAGRKMATFMRGRVFAALGVDPNFINAEHNEGARFNIYAIDKVNDLLDALAGDTGNQMTNAVNRAVLASLKRFSDAGVPFTGLAALAATSDKVKVEKGMTQHLVRHTVSAATANTQASSTMSALRELGVVRNTGTAKLPVWEIVPGPQTERLLSLV